MVQSTNAVLEKIASQAKSFEAIPTGFKKVDEWLDGGFFRKELITIGAFTGTGKSYLAGQLFLTAAQHGFRSGYFSLEISNEMVVSRLLGSLSNLKPTRIRLGQLNESEYKRKLEAVAELVSHGENLLFEDELYRLDDIVGQIKEHRLEYVVIDFIQNVLEKGTDEYSRLSSISLRLQQVAKQQNCVIVVLSQVSNSAAREGSGSRTLEYKGSGNIATVTDLGFFLEREQDGMKSSQDNRIILTLKKNRRGGSGVIFPLFFKHPGGHLYE